MDYIGRRITIELTDGDTVVGKLLAFDRHANLVLADTEHSRQCKRRKSKRMRSQLGLIVLRGTLVQSVSVSNATVSGKNVVDARTSQRDAPVEITNAAKALQAPIQGLAQRSL